MNSTSHHTFTHRTCYHALDYRSKVVNAHWLCPPRPRTQTWAWENINLRKKYDPKFKAAHNKLGSKFPLQEQRELVVPANSGVADEMCTHIPGLNIPALQFPEWVIIQRQGSGCGRCWKAAFKGLHELSDGRLRCSHKDHALGLLQGSLPETDTPGRPSPQASPKVLPAPHKRHSLLPASSISCLHGGRVYEDSIHLLAYYIS